MLLATTYFFCNENRIGRSYVQMQESIHCHGNFSVQHVDNISCLASTKDISLFPRKRVRVYEIQLMAAMIIQRLWRGYHGRIMINCIKEEKQKKDIA